MDVGVFKLGAKSELNQDTTSLRISSNLELGRACLAVAIKRYHLKKKKKLSQVNYEESVLRVLN